jgi:DNA methylase
LVLDPFLGSGTTAVAALRIERIIVGIEQEDFSAGLALSRIVGELVLVEVAIVLDEIDLDLQMHFVDRSYWTKPSVMLTNTGCKLVRTQRIYHFVGVRPRDVVFTVTASSLDDAWRLFRASTHSAADILLVIKAETEIYLAQ